MFGYPFGFHSWWEPWFEHHPMSVPFFYFPSRYRQCMPSRKRGIIVDQVKSLCTETSLLKMTCLIASSCRSVLCANWVTIPELKIVSLGIPLREWVPNLSLVMSGFNTCQCLCLHSLTLCQAAIWALGQFCLDILSYNSSVVFKWPPHLRRLVCPDFLHICCSHWFV